MISRSKLLKWAHARKDFHARDVAKSFRVSRQTASFHLKRLVEQGVLFKTGSTRNAAYSVLPMLGKQPPESLKLVKKISDLEMQSVVNEIQRRFPLKSKLSRNVQSIFFYAFQEMLSNAIAHSGSKSCVVELKLERGIFCFSIEDQGSGVFLQTQKKFDLEDEFSAAYHLFRNRNRVFASPSMGRWIFFASRLADRFSLSSHKVLAKVDNEKKDFILLESRFRRGTRIEFFIKARSKKNLQSYVREWAQESIEWKKNEARVQFVGEELLSRIQARRFLAGLAGLDRIVFDFQNIEGIGQEFADEIFNVFQKQNSTTILEAVNANLSIQFMIARVL